MAERDDLIRELLDIIRATLVDVKRERDCVVDRRSLTNYGLYNSAMIFTHYPLMLRISVLWICSKEHSMKKCTKLLETAELISTRYDPLSFAPRYSKGLSIKLWILHKQKGDMFSSFVVHCST